MIVITFDCTAYQVRTNPEDLTRRKGGSTGENLGPYLATELYRGVCQAARGAGESVDVLAEFVGERECAKTTGWRVS